MKQSDVYSHFMAKKLGIIEDKVEGSKIPNDPRVVINEDEAKESIVHMINDQRAELKKFDDSSNALRKERGGGMAVNSNLKQCTKEDLNVEQKFDDVEITESKILQAPSSFKGDLKHY